MKWRGYNRIRSQRLGKSQAPDSPLMRINQLCNININSFWEKCLTTFRRLCLLKAPSFQHWHTGNIIPAHGPWGDTLEIYGRHSAFCKIIQPSNCASHYVYNVWMRTATDVAYSDHRGCPPKGGRKKWLWHRSLPLPVQLTGALAENSEWNSVVLVLAWQNLE